MYRWRHTAAGEISVLRYFCVKIRNLLHILYRLPLEGCAVISDAVYSEDYVEYIIEYNGDREVLMDLYQPYGLNIIDDRYAVAYQPFPAGYMESFSRLEYNLFPKVYGLMDDVGALEAIGVINIQQENILGLTGKGILLGIVDTGIDIFGSSFVRDGGKTKILAAWDQTVEEADNASYGYGREYSTEEIQAAVDERQRILTDTTGHGSFCAGTAVSVAPSADLVVEVDNAVLNQTREEMGQILMGIDKTLRFHDFRMVRGENRTNLLFDIVVQPGMKPEAIAELKQRVADEAARLNPAYHCILSVDIDHNGVR